MKPCPFCGGTDIATPPGVAVVVCGNCQAAGPVGVGHPTSDVLTERAAVAKWNARTAIEEKRKRPCAPDTYYTKRLRRNEILCADMPELLKGV